MNANKMASCLAEQEAVLRVCGRGCGAQAEGVVDGTALSPTIDCPSQDEDEGASSRRLMDGDEGERQKGGPV